MRTRRLLIHPQERTSSWVQLYMQPVGPRWAAMILPDGAKPPAPGELKGVAFLADSAEAAEWRAIAFLGEDLGVLRGDIVVKSGGPNAL